MKKSRLVICPYCDTEQRVELDRPIVKCKKCGKPINIDIEDHTHPQEFWHNPDTSHKF